MTGVQTCALPILGLRCGVIVVCGSHRVKELRCGGVVLCGGHGGYQTLMPFGVF